jgi:hypothetical protein
MVAALAVCAAGCFSAAKMGFEEMTGQKADIEPIQPITADVRGYRAVQVEQFTSGVGGLVPAALVDGLQAEVIAAIRERGLFPIVGPAEAGAPAEKTLVVGGTIIDYKQPDKGVKRALSKSAIFSVNTYVKDKAAGMELGRCIARGRLTTILRGDETTLMQKAAKSVARFLNEAHTPTPGAMDRMKTRMGDWKDRLEIGAQ